MNLSGGLFSIPMVLLNKLLCIAVSIIPKVTKAKEKALEKVDKKVYSVHYCFHLYRTFLRNHSA